MAWVLIIVGVLVVVAIAVVTIGAVVGRLSVEAPVSVFDEDEAVEWIADRLPFDVAAQLSHDDVRDLVLWHLEYLEAKGVATETAFEATPDAVVVAEDDGLAYVIGKASEAGAGGRRRPRPGRARDRAGLPRGHRGHRVPGGRPHRRRPGGLIPGLPDRPLAS